MTSTPNLVLPFIEASQAQKHVTHNEALRSLDAIVQLAVADVNRTAPPSSPADGQRHIVAASPTGAWNGKAQAVAVWQDGAWAFLTPRTGWRAWSVADGTLMTFDGSAWRNLRTLPLDNLSRLGVNAAASSPNLLAVRSNAALFNAINAADGGSGDLRLQLSKEAAANTASLVFSNAFSGRAEFGLAGDDDFHVKVSADGSSWAEAIRIARATGKVSFPANGGPRETLTASRTYYVRTDGNDANSGRTNSSAGALLTVQKAVDTVASLDLSTYQVIIQLADGTYTGAVELRPYLGALPPIIQGNAATPANVVVTATGTTITNAGAGVWRVNDLKIRSTSGNGLNSVSGATIRFQNLDFGTTGSFHMYVGPSSNIVATGNYQVSGGAQLHVAAVGYVSLVGATVTYAGSPAFSAANVIAGRGGIIDSYSVSFVNGSGVTGQRYIAQHNGVIFTDGGGANFFPGNVAGTTLMGGIYV